MNVTKGKEDGEIGVGGGERKGRDGGGGRRDLEVDSNTKLSEETPKGRGRERLYTQTWESTDLKLLTLMI